MQPLQYKGANKHKSQKPITSTFNYNSHYTSDFRSYPSQIFGSNIPAMKSSSDVLDASESSTTLHAPEKLQPLQRNIKSRNSNVLGIEDPLATDLKLNRLSPEPIKPIPMWRSRTNQGLDQSMNSEGKYRL